MKLSKIKNYLSKHGFENFEPKAVLFDMDGVLYNSMPNHALAWQRSMAVFDLHMTEADAYATEGARGIDTIRRMVRKQKGKNITPERAQEMYDEKTRQFHLMDEAPLMPGILDLMGRIRRQGLQIGVVTGSGQRPLIDRLLTDFSDYLDEQHIVTAYDVKRGKPAPDPYLMGMKKVGTKPWQTIIVENAPLGVKAGTAARAFTIAVNTGPLPDDVLTSKGADLLFAKVTDLRDAWPKLFPKKLTMSVSQDKRWEQNFAALKQFIEKNKCLPSKHRIEDHRLLNWLKYNRKLVARDKLSPERQARFEQLLAASVGFHKLNQYSYTSGKSVTPKKKKDDDKQLTLF